MSHRTTSNLLVRAVATRLDRFNRRHPWSHNDHFHAWVLHHLPAHPRRALDVGCGAGALLERLAERVDKVVGIDPDPGMAAATRERLAGTPGAEVRGQGFADLPAEEDGSYDLVTMVASLHHLPMLETLQRVRTLLAPGGRLLVVGLATVGTPKDALVDLTSVVINPLVGLAKHPHAVTADDAPDLDTEPTMPVRKPAHTYDQVAEVADLVLPGAHFRRRLFFRYTLQWTRRDDV